MADITELIQGFRKYDSDLSPETRESLGADIIYRTLVKTVREAEKFNYHSDYWGQADAYQESNVEVMREIKPYIGKIVTLDGMTGKLLGLLIDKQYNSLSHSALLLEIS